MRADNRQAHHQIRQSVDLDRAPRKEIVIEIAGELAMFTDPTQKIERFSYPCITPSAARAVLEAVYWKPQMAYDIKRIQINNPIRYMDIMTNEVSRVANASDAKTGKGLIVSENRMQRKNTFLRDVSYSIWADVVLLQDNEQYNGLIKHTEMLRKRLIKGKHFRQPYLGLQECFAHVQLAGPVPPEPADVNLIQTMLLDIANNKEGHRVRPIFFPARIESGVLEVQGHLASRMYKGGNG
jgi:CRISPR-associated protein Cas5d